jgi:hypothetical protein
MKTSNRREEVLMSKKSSIALLAIGIGALFTFASPLPAEAMAVLGMKPGVKERDEKSARIGAKFKTTGQSSGAMWTNTIVTGILYVAPIVRAQALRKLRGYAMK